MNKERYCVGYWVDRERQTVLMVQKQRPDWQRGKLNGPGGKVHWHERQEQPIDAMIREFHEETGRITMRENWRETILLVGPNWEVHFFLGYGSSEGCRLASLDLDFGTMPEDGRELLYEIPLDELPQFGLVSNVMWTLFLSLDENMDFPITIFDKQFIQDNRRSL